LVLKYRVESIYNMLKEPMIVLIGGGISIIIVFLVIYSSAFEMVLTRIGYFTAWLYYNSINCLVMSVPENCANLGWSIYSVKK
jgi:hypothetical protein